MDKVDIITSYFLHSQQLKHNFLNRHQYHVEYDAYLMNRAEKRVIRSALSALSVVFSYTTLNKSKKLIQELLFAFNNIPLSTHYKNALSSIKLARYL